MAATMTIRPAATSDIESMVTLLRLLFAIEADFNFDAERQQRGLNLLLAAANARVLVAVEHGAVIGMATGQLLISTAEGGLSLLIEDVVVTPSWQNQGIGSALLAGLADWGARQGVHRMQLLADQTNTKALDFYRHNHWLQTQLICLRKYQRKEF